MVSNIFWLFAADEDDWYLATIGPKTDGSWGFVQFNVFVRLCDLVITSSRAEDFAWSAGRALIRYVVSAMPVMLGRSSLWQSSTRPQWH